MNKNKPIGIIFDIDGCISESSKRFSKLDITAALSGDKAKYIESIREYDKDCFEDSIIEPGLDLLIALTNFYNPEKIFFITARGGGNRGPALQWLKDENIWDDKCELIMREEDLDVNNFQITFQEDHAIYKQETARELGRTLI